MENPRFLSYSEDKAGGRDRCYIKISKVLPDIFAYHSFEFISHNKSWTILAFLSEKSFNVCVSSTPNCNHLFNVHLGIVGDDEKEFRALDATRNGVDRDWLSAKDIISRSDLQSFLQTNKVTYLFAEIRRHDVINEKKRKYCGRNIETDYEELFLNGINSDMAIKVKHKKFKCHKCILGARSPVFAAMMEHDMKEKTSGIVNIEDSEPTTFQQFLLYLYTGSRKHLSWENVTELYKLGKKYVVEDLVNLCVKHMEDNITIEKFYDFFLLSLLYNESKLSGTLIDFFLKKSKKITQSEKWLVFLSENPAECNVLIKALAHK